MTAPPVDPRQAEYAAYRHAWRKALEVWLRGGRLGWIRVRLP